MTGLSIRDVAFLGAAAGFSPLSLSPALWLDASDTSTITESGGAVSQWDNKGSLGNFTQGTGAVQPTTGVTTQNGLNVIDFASDYLTSADATSAYKFMHDGSQHTIFIVARVNTGSGNIGFLGNNRGSASFSGSAYSYVGGANDSLDQYTTASGAVLVCLLRNPVLTEDSYELIRVTNDHGNATTADRTRHFLDGVESAGRNSRSGSPAANNPSYPMQVGAIGLNVWPFTGSIAELIVVDGVLTAGQIIDTEQYLVAKWGL